MRIPLVSLSLALLAFAVRAQEGADVTAQLPKGPVAFRVASFDRVDAIVKEWLPMLKAMGLEKQVAELEQMPASNWIFVKSGLSPDLVDRTKPIYVGGQMEHEKPVVVLHPAAGAAWEGKKELREGGAAILRGGAIVVGEGAAIDAEARGTPTKFHVEGDAVLHVYLADIIAENKEEIEQEAAQAVMGLGAAGIPQEAQALILPVVTAAKNGLYSLESFDYGVTWGGERAETEGFVAIQEGSGLRNLLKRVGEPGSTDLVAYLPKDAFMTFSGVMNPDWPLKEMKDLVQKAGDEGVAEALVQFVAYGVAFADNVTGRSAGWMNMNWMAMTPMVSAIYELKPGVDGKKMFETLDFAKVNAAMKKIGIPIEYTIEKAAAKHGETELHKLTMTSDNPMFAAQFSMLQQYWAVENGLLFLSMSPTGEDDIKAVIDRVRRGEKAADHPHALAMARLGRGHNLGFTINLGALKPMAMMLGMFLPQEAVMAFQRIPDVLTLSTAVTFPDGNIRWRGDWPVKEIAKVAESIRKAMPAEEAPPPEKEDEKFD